MWIEFFFNNLVTPEVVIVIFGISAYGLSPISGSCTVSVEPKTD